MRTEIKSKHGQQNSTLSSNSSHICLPQSSSRDTRLPESSGSSSSSNHTRYARVATAAVIHIYTRAAAAAIHVYPRATAAEAIHVYPRAAAAIYVYHRAAAAGKMECQMGNSQMFRVDPEVFPKKKRRKNPVRKKVREIISPTLPVTSLPIQSFRVTSLPVTSLLPLTHPPQMRVRSNMTYY